MTRKRLHAKCLCGGVRVDADFEELEIAACHCDSCRRWTAGPFLTVEGATNVIPAGIDSLGIYRSSEWGERGFCRTCGTALFWRSVDGEHYALSATAIDDLGDPPFVRQIFVDSKPNWYEFANQTEMMTGAEFFAKVAPTQEEPHG